MASYDGAKWKVSNLFCITTLLLIFVIGDCMTVCLIRHTSIMGLTSLLINRSVHIFCHIVYTVQTHFWKTVIASHLDWKPRGGWLQDCAEPAEGWFAWIPPHSCGLGPGDSLLPSDAPLLWRHRAWSWQSPSTLWKGATYKANIFRPCEFQISLPATYKYNVSANSKKQMFAHEIDLLLCVPLSNKLQYDISHTHICITDLSAKMDNTWHKKDWHLSTISHCLAFPVLYHNLIYFNLSHMKETAKMTFKNKKLACSKTYMRKLWNAFTKPLFYRISPRSFYGQSAWDQG